MIDESPEKAEHEAEIYLQLPDAMGRIVDVRIPFASELFARQAWGGLMHSAATHLVLYARATGGSMVEMDNHGLYTDVMPGTLPLDLRQQDEGPGPSLGSD
jgi:hypothetical protein